MLIPLQTATFLINERCPLHRRTPSGDPGRSEALPVCTREIIALTFPQACGEDECIPESPVLPYMVTGCYLSAAGR